MKTRTAGRTLAVAFLALGGAASAAPPQSTWHEHAVAGVCTLRISLPQPWQPAFHDPAPRAVAITIKPSDGSRGEILITGLAPAKGSAVQTPDEIRKAAEQAGEKMLPGSVEKHLDLVRVDGKEGVGFFYSLTDANKALPKDQYRFMTQGISGIGPLRLAITVLADEADSAGKTAALDLVRTAECPAAAR